MSGLLRMEEKRNMANIGRKTGVAISLQNCLWRRISLLQIDIPVLQFLKRDRHTAHRAAHKRTRPHDAEIAIEVFHLRLAIHWRGAIIAVEQ